MLHSRAPSVTFPDGRETEELHHPKVIPSSNHLVWKQSIGSIYIVHLRILGPYAVDLRTQHGGPGGPLNGVDLFSVGDTLATFGTWRR